MTEFEAATVAFQQGTLAYQQAALALQQGQLEAARNIPLVAGLVGLGQILVVAAGIWVMRRAGDQREKREDARHREAMRALEALIGGMEQQGEALRQQGEALRQQGEALRQQGEALRQQGEALRQQGEALGPLVKGMETVIERTAPRQ